MEKILAQDDAIFYLKRQKLDNDQNTESKQFSNYKSGNKSESNDNCFSKVQPKGILKKQNNNA